MLECRVLPPAEWPRLVGTESEPFASCAPHLDVHPVVVEEGGRLVGTWTQTTYTVAEGIWVLPEHRRRVAVFRSLLTGMHALLRERGTEAVVTACMSAEVERMLRHYGAVESPARYFVLPVREHLCQGSR